MRSRAIPILTLLSAVILAQAALAQGDTAARDVASVSRAMSAAEAKNDLDALGRIWAEDYTQVSSDGKTETRQQTLNDRRSGRIHFDSIDVKEIRADVYGNAAVTHELMHVKGRLPVGHLDTDERALRVFVRRGGRWQCVTTQYTVVK